MIAIEIINAFVHEKLSGNIDSIIDYDLGRLRIDGWSINQYRGCHAEWHDYEDRFLAALYKVLTEKSDHEEDLQDFVQLNE